MATSADRGFIEQLREMRATRTQQLRQGNQEAALLNRQITSLNNLDKTMRAVLKTQNLSATSLKDINTKQNNMIRQSDQMSKSINNLSTSLTRSVSSLASAAAKGTGSAVGSAGSAVVGAASSVSSSIVSVLAKTLPFAIAGVVGKMFVYDKMDESTKKELGDSFSGLMSSIFGDIDTSSFGKIVKPISKELGIVFGALGDTLGGVTEQITKLVKKIENMDFKRVSEALDNISKTVLGIINNPELKYYIDKGVAASRAVGRIGEYIPEDGSAVVSATVGAGALAYGAVRGSQKIVSATSQVQPVAQAVTSAAAASKISTATVSRNLSNKEIKVMEKSLEAMKKFKLGKGAVALLVGRLAALSELGMISGGAKFLTALKDYKAGSRVTAALSFLAVAISVFTIQMINEQIDTMVENGIVSPGDGEWLKGYLQSEEISSLVGSIVFGTAGFVGGFAVAGPVGSVGLGITGSISGGSVGADIGREGYEFFNPMPDTLKSTDYEQKTNNILKQQYYNQSQRSNNQNDPREREQGVSRGSRPPAAMSNKENYQLTGYLIDFIKRKEGFRARPYGDYKQLSIGYGTKANSPDEVIDEKEAEKRMIEKLTGFQKTVLDYNSKYGYNWNQSQIDALTSFTYNAGEGNLKTLLDDGKRSNEEIAAKMKEYNKAGGKLNEGLVERRGIEISMFTGGKNSEPSFASADPGTATTSASYNDNYARRKKEAKEAEKYEDGSDNFVGPSLKETKQSPSQFAGMSIKQFTSDFAKTTQDLTSVFEEIFASQNSQQVPMTSTDQSTNINQVNSGGGGGTPSVSSVISGNMADRNWQFNALAGSSTA